MNDRHDENMIPYFVHEGCMDRAERHLRRVSGALIVSGMCNLLWMIHEWI